MATFKLNISDKKGRTITKEVKEKEAGPFLGLTLGAELDAALVGEAGKLKITGGSDKSEFHSEKTFTAVHENIFCYQKVLD